VNLSFDFTFRRKSARIILASSLIGILVSSPSFAQAIGGAHIATGSELLTYCARSSGHAQSACLGYIAGVSDSMISRQIASTKNRGKACISRSVKAGDRAATVIAWLSRHVDQLNQPAAGLIMRALSEAYPCERK